MIVLDSSAVVEWILGLPLADAVAQRMVEAVSLHVPALLDVEVAQVVRRYSRLKLIDQRVAERALEVIADLDVVRYTHESLLPLIWHFRNNLTAYDAAYVALAKVLEVPLLTLDARIPRALSSSLFGKNIEIELLR